MKVDLFNGHDGQYGGGSVGVGGWTELALLNDFSGRLLKVLRRPEYKDLDWAQWLDTKGVHESDDVRKGLRKDALAVLFHTNAASKDAHGTEVFFLTDNQETKHFAQLYLEATTSALGTTSRGVKNYTDYYLAPFIRTKTNKAILVELFFGTNRDDFDTYFKNGDKLAENIARLIVEACGGKWGGGIVKPTPQPEKPKPVDKPKYNAVKDYAEDGRFTCKVKEGIVAYKNPELTTRADVAADLELNEYTDYDHVYYVTEAAGSGKGYVVVRSEESGNFFPIRVYDNGKFGSPWGIIV